MKRRVIAAIVIIVAIGLWMATGDIIVGGQGEAAPSPADTGQTEAAPPRVATRIFGLRERIAHIGARGRTEADQRVDIRAQIDGLVEQTVVNKGDTVAKGDVICRIETAARKATLAQAEAQLAQADLDYEATVKLNQKGYAADTKVRALKAQRDAAEAARTAARWTLERTEVRAPISGRVETLPVEIGSYLKPGDICATVVDSDPMLVIVNVSERQIGNLAVGMDAGVRTVDGREAAGRISFIAGTADAQTRTFRVEIAVPNPDGSIREGMTAELAIALPPVKAHLLPASVLVLADDGEIGVRAVNGDNKVEFFPVSILSDDDGGMWVSGLPDKVNIIVTGQEFVQQGVVVTPVPAESGAAS
ncbi:MAG: efflux RND transporter periplasmic adaptor subunit [Flavobacteriaceae bacterium]